VTRRAALAAGAGMLVAVVAIGAVAALSANGPSAKVAPTASVNTAAVQRGALSAAISQDGILTYRARPDGSPFTAINQARGTYTALPEVGDKVDCGDVLYRVNDHPVLLLCGAIPAYRALHEGDLGADVGQLNTDLHVRGAGKRFTAQTARALEQLQRHRGSVASGALTLGDAVFLPQPLRIARVIGQLGAAAQPGAVALSATSSTLHVEVNLDPADQGHVARGDRVQITLPGNTTVTGRVDGFGRVAAAPSSESASAADATIPTYIGLDDPSKARSLDRAPVDVSITTAGVHDALSVPVTALVGRAGGGFAVELAGPSQRRALVAVRLGLFDTAGGRVQVDGDLRAGDRVMVPTL
jgi:hypothetical protein